MRKFDMHLITETYLLTYIYRCDSVLRLPPTFSLFVLAKFYANVRYCITIASYCASGLKSKLISILAPRVVAATDIVN